MGAYIYPQAVENLPITSHLDEICNALKKSKSHFLVLTADTGSGKSTVIPFGLLNNFSGNIYMLEPRRLAVLNVANRVSELLEEKPGQTCGYNIRMENKTSRETRFTVMTEAVLIRKIQSDPELNGVSVVVLDEFHERSVHADLALAFLKEIVSLRNDLFVIIMSATMETSSLVDFLGNGKKEDVSVMNIEGRRFPVEISYKPEVSLKNAVISEYNYLINNSPAGESASVLVFLPGIYEINQLYSELSDSIKEQNLLILHSSVPIEKQKSVFYSTGTVRVILSSAIAETSVTVPDVKVVIDTGDARLNLYDPGSGMNRLVTRRVSQFNAMQRAGRAGRVSKGKCVRLWGQSEVLVQAFPPEIERSDLCDVVLECYKWGITSPEKLAWLTRPDAAAWKKAEALLYSLMCLKDGRVTVLGEICLFAGLGVRCSCVAAGGLFHRKLKFSTGIAVKYLSDAKTSVQIQQKQALEVEKRLQIYEGNPQLKALFPQPFDNFSTGCALLFGFPDRLGVKTAENTYQFYSGKTAVLKNPLPCSPEFIVAVYVNAGTGEGVVYEYEPLEPENAQKFLEKWVQIKQKAFFEGTKVVKVEQSVYGVVVLKEKKLTVLPEDYREAVCNAVVEKGFRWLPVSDAAEKFLLRVRFYEENSCPVSESLEERLRSNVKEWLLPFITGTVINEGSVYDALFYYLEGDKINRTVPVELVLDNKKKRKFRYELQNGKVIPVLEVIIQDVFGCFKTPVVMEVPVLLRLLSPARRPLQITRDLEHFWDNTWPEIAKEMKGRYPKHNWNYKVTDDKE